MNDIKNCCGTTCDKTSTEKYIESIEIMLCAYAAAGLGKEPKDCINLPSGFDSAIAEKHGEQALRKHMKPEFL